MSGYDDNEIIAYIESSWPKSKPLPDRAAILSMTTEQHARLIEKLEVNSVRVRNLVTDPEERKKRSFGHLKKVLDWLRWEPYSTVEIMSLVTGVGMHGTRKMLNKFVREGWLVRDEVPWVGVPGKLHLFGISSKGLYHLLGADDDEPGPNRDFKRGRASASTGPHILNIQLARLYLQRYKLSDGEERRYRAARDLPGFGLPDAGKKKMPMPGNKSIRWETYPDAVIDNSHRVLEDGDERGLSIAIEIEQHSKGSKRYRELIKAHMKNIKTLEREGGLYSARYDLVIYYLPTYEESNNLERLFRRIIAEPGFGSPDDRAATLGCFEFKSYEFLADDIRELD